MSSAVVISLMALVLVTQVIFSMALPPYLYDTYVGEDYPGSSVGVGGGTGTGYGDIDVDRLLQGLNKRSCIRRGGRCDHRPDDCCSGGACRCNLWGTNCQCQRMGIFQKWG